VIDAMSSVLITGSNDGLGRDAARRLVDDGHRVVGHARSTEKADALRRELPGLADVLVADLSSATQVRRLAQDADAMGTFDAVIHNAGIGFRERAATRRRTGTRAPWPSTRSRPTCSRPSWSPPGASCT
jgi:NAD(P)-dependent dehydrogenase (short-subunit alcohol dehydrogenase family)